MSQTMWCSDCGRRIFELHYAEDGAEICEACSLGRQAEEQAEEEIADAATDMPRWDGD